MKKIKILMIAGSMHVGGIENQLMHLARNADKEKYQIDFTSTKADAFYRKEIENLGGKFVLIPPMDWKKPKAYIETLLRVMREGHYDVVHTHELFHSGITLWIAKKAGIPCRFVHAHNWRDDDGSGRKTSLLRRIYNVVMRASINHYSTVQIACSTWAGKFLYGERMQRRSSYHLVFNSVDTEKFLEHFDQTEDGEFCEEDGWKNVINVARISAVKNQTFLVDVAEELRKRGKRIRILCAGSGDECDVLAVKKKIIENSLEEYIQLLGVRKDIDVLMRRVNAFVLPSKYEGMPLVMIEAQASGLPCVSADTYSREVDFGIGSVTWLPLEAGAAAWADALEIAIKKERASKSEIEEAVRKKRFDSRMFAQTLCELYQEDYARRGKIDD